MVARCCCRCLQARREASTPHRANEWLTRARRATPARSPRR
jgi:hypothetical protein